MTPKIDLIIFGHHYDKVFFNLMVFALFTNSSSTTISEYFSYVIFIGEHVGLPEYLLGTLCLVNGA